MSSGVCRTAGFLSEACWAFTRHPGHRRGYFAKQVLLAKRRLSGNDVASPSGACSAASPSSRALIAAGVKYPARNEHTPSPFGRAEERRGAVHGDEVRQVAGAIAAEGLGPQNGTVSDSEPRK
jgi:hypothetical protein